MIGSWDASTITWNSAPGSMPGQGRSSTVTAGGQWVDMDITPWVHNWANGVWPNRGFLIETYNSRFSIGSIENPTNRSYLTVTYQGWPWPVQDLSATSAKNVVNATWSAPNGGDVSTYSAVLRNADTGAEVRSKTVCGTCATTAQFTGPDGVVDNQRYRVDVTA